MDLFTILLCFQNNIMKLFYYCIGETLCNLTSAFVWCFLGCFFKFFTGWVHIGSPDVFWQYLFGCFLYEISYN